ncbi:MAG: hypothetical protein ISS90_01140 [Candidatus Omnitrophica bacterium]|nr:hypothetical protein [Candidatus Omnitrophota bacterium]
MKYLVTFIAVLLVAGMLFAEMVEKPGGKVAVPDGIVTAGEAVFEFEYYDYVELRMHKIQWIYDSLDGESITLLEKDNYGDEKIVEVPLVGPSKNEGYLKVQAFIVKLTVGPEENLTALLLE